MYEGSKGRSLSTHEQFVQSGSESMDDKALCECVQCVSHMRRRERRVWGSWCRGGKVRVTAVRRSFWYNSRRVVGDAKGIRKKITEMKMRLIKVALKATGRG